MDVIQFACDVFVCTDLIVNVMQQNKGGIKLEEYHKVGPEGVISECLLS